MSNLKNTELGRNLRQITVAQFLEEYGSHLIKLPLNFNGD